MPVENHNMLPKGMTRRIFSLSLIVLLVVGITLSAWTVHRVNQRFRNELLQHARFVARMVNLTRVKALTGTDADLNSPDYLRIKEQLARARAAADKCRFLYLMGRRTDGQVFFLVDSLPPGSPNYAPPGLVYSEISVPYLQSFDKKQEIFVGPITDRWGTLVTALIPLFDPDTGELVAMLGMDIEAEDWKWSIAAASAPTVALLLSLTILLVSWAAWSKSRKASLEKLAESRAQLLSMFDGIDGPNYVSDPETYEVIYINQATRNIWGEPGGRKCHEYLHHRDSPCPFCTNDKLFGENFGRVSYLGDRKPGQRLLVPLHRQGH